MSFLSRMLPAGEKPEHSRWIIEETPGHKIVRNLFCAGMALSCMLSPLHAGATTAMGGQIVELSGDHTGQEGGVISLKEGDVKNNRVTLTGGDYLNVFGGRSGAGSGAVTDNRLEISGGTVGNDATGGDIKVGSQNGSNIENNIVIMTGGYSKNTVNGAVSHGAGNITGNRVEMSGGIVDNAIYGGRSRIEGNQGGNVENNAIILSGNAKIGSGVYAGESHSVGNVRNNTVSITDATVEVRNHIIGGNHEGTSGEVTGNRVVMSGGVTNYVYGARHVQGKNVSTDSRGNVENNTVVMHDGTVGNTIYGGYSNVSGNVTGNAIYLDGGTVGKHLYAGAIAKDGTGNVTGNKVDISGGAVGKSVYGGRNDNEQNGDAVGNNTVTLSGTARIDEQVIGGKHFGTGSVSENTVTVNGGTIVKGIIGGQSVSGAVTGNAIRLNSGKVQGDTYAGNSTSGNVSRNAIRLDGGNVSGTLYGGYSASGTVSGNTVAVNGGTVEKGITGGRSTDGAVTGNAIRLDGGKVEGTLYAGHSTTGNITGNIIHLNGKNGNTGEIDITGAWLYGSNLQTNDSKATGNTLNIRNYTGKAQNIGQFQKINLDLTGQPLSETTPILTLTENRPTDLDHSAIAIHSGNQPTAVTRSKLIDRYEVIKNASGAGLTARNAAYPNREITVRQQGSLQALYRVEWDHADSIDLVRTGETETVPGTEIIPQSRLGMASFLNEAGDFIFDRKLECSIREDGSIPETCFYGAVSGGDLHHDLNGDKAWAHTTGTHWFLGIRSKLNEKEDTEKDVNGALYAEAGWGNLDTHNRWARGDGDIHYYGIGVIAERKQKKGDWKGAYIQAHARAGRAFADYESRLRDGSGEKLDYDENSAYYGAGLEIGREWQYHPDYMLDTRLKYRWLHLNGIHTGINGADYHLDDIDSHRTRLGTRLNYTGEKTGMPYIGIAWEHEFSGSARGNVEGCRLRDTSLKGDSGVLELGVKFVPSEKSRWHYDFTIEGYVGQQEGVMGNFVVNYLF